MPYTTITAEKYTGQVVGDGQCVSFVKKVASAPVASSWNEGAKVKNNLSIQAGTAIAVFQNGKYLSHTDGTSHAAIYLKQDTAGIWVMDQWKGQPVHKRYIRFNNPRGKMVNNGDNYSVVE
jgi:hypothetical protein